MIITKETDYALRILRVLLDGEKHSVAEMSETELIPTQFAYQILRKLSAGNLVRVSRGALGGCELSCDLDATSLYDLRGVDEVASPGHLPGLRLGELVILEQVQRRGQVGIHALLSGVLSRDLVPFRLSLLRGEASPVSHTPLSSSS